MNEITTRGDAPAPTESVANPAATVRPVDDAHSDISTFDALPIVPDVLSALQELWTANDSGGRYEQGATAALPARPDPTPTLLAARPADKVVAAAVPLHGGSEQRVEWLENGLSQLRTFLFSLADHTVAATSSDESAEASAQPQPLEHEASPNMTPPAVDTAVASGGDDNALIMLASRLRQVWQSLAAGTTEASQADSIPVENVEPNFPEPDDKIMMAAAMPLAVSDIQYIQLPDSVFDVSVQVPGALHPQIQMRPPPRRGAEPAEIVETASKAPAEEMQRDEVPTTVDPVTLYRAYVREPSRDLRLHLGNLAGLDRQLGPQSRSPRSCFRQRQGTATICLVEVAWPARAKGIFDIRSPVYAGAKAIVRVVDGRADRMMSFFYTGDFDQALAHFSAEFGQPTEIRTWFVADFGARRAENVAAYWRSVDDVSGRTSVFELRKFDDERGMLPDNEFGFVRLFTDGSTKIFEQVDSADFIVHMMRSGLHQQ